MAYLRRTLQVRILIDMAMDSHTPATEYGCWEEHLIRDQCTYNLFFFNLLIFELDLLKHNLAISGQDRSPAIKPTLSNFFIILG